jgi:starch synthase
LCKRAVLDDAAPALLVTYDLPPGADGITIHTCLSPDYYRLLRHGAAELQRTGGTSWQGASSRATQVWVALADDEDTTWCDPEAPDPGHGVLISLRAQAGSFHLLIGLGEIDEEAAQEMVKSGRERLATLAAGELTGGRA